MLYSSGNYFIKGSLPIHQSSQNLISVPFCTTNFPLGKKCSLTSINHDQNWESPGCLTTCEMVLFFRYFLLSNCRHAPSSLMSLYSHLLKRQIFWTSKSIIPKPPTHLGEHRILHLANLYFLLCPSFCQKNLNL